MIVDSDVFCVNNVVIAKPLKHHQRATQRPFMMPCTGNGIARLVACSLLEDSANLVYCLIGPSNEPCSSSHLSS